MTGAITGGRSHTCSVVIATRNRAGLLDRCLRALVSQAPHEIIVVENSVPGGTAATRSCAAFHGARYVEHESGGLSAARNAGWRAASGDIVAFTDDDAVPDEAWVVSITGAFADATIDAATGRILPLAAETESEKHALRAAAGGVFGGDAPRIIDRSVPDWFAMAAFGGAGNGGNMAFRRSLLAQGFSFDERTGRGAPLMAFDEHYIFLQLISAGHRVAYVPDALVRHPLPASLDELRRAKLRDYAALGAYATLLMVESPHRRDTLAYALGGIVGRRRVWRDTPQTAGPRVISRARAALAVATGPFRYLRARLR